MAKSKARTKTIIDLKDPKSPVSGWKHYGIFSYTEKRIRTLLDESGYKSGYLIGLQVGYVYRKRSYMMAFGYGVGEQERQMPDAQTVLGRDLFIALYRELRTLFKQNSDASGDISVNLDLTISGSLFQISFECDIVQQGECDANPNHVGQVMILSRVGNENWKCTHQIC
jgi:hypothetical protein